MGFISNIYGGIQRAITTEQGKVITGFAYGVGASIVIIGALFKILHLPGASEMLMVGMGAEAFLFALGAFEPPHVEYDWSSVYPELSHGHAAPAKDETEKPAKAINTNTSPAQTATVHSTQIGGLGELLEPEDLVKLQEGLKKLGDTANKMNDISGASIATDNYIKNIEKASNAADHFSEVQVQGSEAIKTASNSFSETFNTVVTSFQSSFEDAHKNSTESLKQASSQLLSAYAGAAKILEKNSEDITNDSSHISTTLAAVNTNLSKINSVYELQLNEINQQLEESKNRVNENKKINDSLTHISNNYAESVKDSEDYKNQASKLNKQITDLNSIYGNMLNALNIES